MMNEVDGMRQEDYFKHWVLHNGMSDLRFCERKKRAGQGNFRHNKKYVLWNAGICPIASKVGHVTLATPTFRVIHHPL